MIWAILVAVGIVLYLGYCAGKAYYYVRDLPRDEMFICGVHGPVNKKYILKLDVLSGKKMEYCTLCFSEKMKAAKESAK